MRNNCNEAQPMPDSEQTEPSARYDELHPPPLDRCPFCGDQAIYVLEVFQCRYTWKVECMNCHASLGSKLDRSKCEAAEEWNHRWSPNSHTKTSTHEPPTSCLEAFGEYDTPLAIDVDDDEDVGAADWR